MEARAMTTPGGVMKYLYADRDRHGNVRCYFWRGKGHKKIRIHDAPGSPEFHAVYSRLLAGDDVVVEAPKVALAPVKPQTFRWLCVQYFQSGEFTRLKGRTPSIRKRVLELCCLEPMAPGSNK